MKQKIKPMRKLIARAREEYYLNQNLPKSILILQILPKVTYDNPGFGLVFTNVHLPKEILRMKVMANQLIGKIGKLVNQMEMEKKIV